MENNILELVEIKRVCENLKKRELCEIYGISYTYYVNNTIGASAPSKRMIESLTEYLNTKTSDVYKKVFAYRSSPLNVAKKGSKFFEVDGVWKEKFHESLGINEDDYRNGVKLLKGKGVLEEPIL
ncbi:hypothetical protein [Bacillus pumilus]|uniref:hypothetical protein n=1 Tax=Bacillus pumilus TaxID=1408 RepID=UPI0011AA97FE|nr:hypothetical protein [Bacillus pumilus]